MKILVVFKDLLYSQEREPRLAIELFHGQLTFPIFVSIKGQLISKGNFGVFNSPKKRT